MLLRHPLDRWFRFAILRLHVEVLALSLPILVLFVPIRKLLVAFTPRCPSGIYRDMQPEQIAAVVARRLRHPWLMRHTRCLRQSLASFYLMRLAGIPASIHFAVYPFTQTRGKAHCWVTSQGKCLTIEPERPFAEVLVHSAE